MQRGLHQVLVVILEMVMVVMVEVVTAVTETK
jgi:hypothetical protein